MSTVVTASGLPGSLSSAAALNVNFGPVLDWPANLTNKPVLVRASGSLSLPSGNYGGTLAVGIALQSNNSPLMKVALGLQYALSGVPRILPFRVVASVYGDPFQGYILDVNTPNSIFAKSGNALVLQQSGGVIGEQNQNHDEAPTATAVGGGTMSFGSQIPLIVLANFFNQGGTSSSPSASDGSPVLPTITGNLTQFELEY